MTIRITAEGVVISTTLSPLNSKRLALEIEISLKVRDAVKRWDVKNKVAVQVVLVNLIACSRKKQLLFYSRQKNKRVRDTYSSRGLNNADIITAIDDLERLGMLVNYVADRQFISEIDKAQSWVVITDKFIDKFCTNTSVVEDAELAHLAANINIELRSKEDKSRVDYVMDETITEADKMVAALNEMNSKHIVLSEGGALITNIYTRIFSNGSFLLGGRWYRAQILKLKNKATKDRLKVTIDNEPVCEIDFDCLHISILADELGVGHLYDTDIYYKILETEHWSVNNRTLVKFSVNVCLNATSYKGACAAINKFIKESPAGTYCFIQARDVISSIYDKLPHFKNEFCNKDSTGLRLQNKDSWIAHNVVNKFITEQYPILVIHDSFICKRKDADMLSSAMSDAYKKVVGVSRVVRMKINWVDQGIVQVADCFK